MNIYLCIVINANGSIDAEMLDNAPTQGFIESLSESLMMGDIARFEIRQGNINGGDSALIVSSHG